MKLKGINPFEQHAEKIVAGVLGAAALGVVAYQFMRPTTVSLDQNKVTPEDAFESIQRRAADVEARLRAEEPPEQIATAVVPDVAGELERRLRSRVAPAPSLAVALGRPSVGLRGDARSGGASYPSYALVEAPAPEKPVVGMYAGTVDPLVVLGTPGLAELAPESQPYDLRLVSVAAMFPAGELVRRLNEDPDGSGPLQPTPRFWWSGRLAALDVALERQSMRADGTWGEVEVVEPMPGRVSVRGALSSEGLTPERFSREALTPAREAARDILRPSVYPIIAGAAWAPPTAAAEAPTPGATTAARPAEVERKLQELRRVEQSIERIQKSIEDRRNRERDRGGRRTGGGGGGPSNSVAGSGSGSGSGSGWVAQPARPGAPGGSNPPQPPAEPGSPEQPRQERDPQQENLARFQQQRDALMQEIRNAGFDPATGSALGVEGSASAPAPMVEEALPSLETAESLLVWGHDLTARPGETYRYRVRVVVINPLFGQEKAMAEESQVNAASPVLVSEPSPWSEPMTVEGDTRVFFTQAFAQEEGEAGLGGPDSLAASAEIYRFHYGHWRRARATLRPGDALAARVETPALPIFEIGPGAGGALEVKGETAGPGWLDVGLSGFVVDIAPAPAEPGTGQRSNRRLVVYRDGDGRLVVSDPERDRDSARRREAEASDVAGASATVGRPGGG